MVEVLIPIVEQLLTVKEFVIHRLVLHLNLSEMYNDLRSKDYPAILR